MLRLLKHKSVLAALIVLILGFIFLIGWRLLNGASGTGTGREQLQATLKKVDRLIVLPKDEEPTLATITDKGKISDPFLAKGENGDQVLIYYKAKKAIIYRPRLNKIVDIGPVAVDPSIDEVKDTKIVIRNGTTNQDLTAEVQDKIKKAFPQVNIISTGSTSRSNFPSTIVVDLTETSKYNLVGSIAREIGGQRGVLPFSEPSPEGAEILVIIGGDQS